MLINVTFKNGNDAIYTGNVLEDMLKHNEDIAKIEQVEKDGKDYFVVSVLLEKTWKLFIDNHVMIFTDSYKETIAKAKNALDNNTPIKILEVLDGKLCKHKEIIIYEN